MISTAAAHDLSHHVTKVQRDTSYKYQGIQLIDVLAVSQLHDLQVNPEDLHL